MVEEDALNEVTQLDTIDDMAVIETNEYSLNNRSSVYNVIANIGSLSLESIPSLVTINI